MNLMFTKYFKRPEKKLTLITSHIYFVVKQNFSNKALFYYVLAFLILGILPYVFNNKGSFSIYYKYSTNYMVDLFFFYFPTATFFLEAYSKNFNNQSFSTITNIPHTHELENYYNKSIDFLDYIPSYKMVIFLDFKTKNFFLNEGLMRLFFKLPIKYV